MTTHSYKVTISGPVDKVEVLGDGSFGLYHDKYMLPKAQDDHLAKAPGDLTIQTKRSIDPSTPNIVVYEFVVRVDNISDQVPEATWVDRSDQPDEAFRYPGAREDRAAYEKANGISVIVEHTRPDGSITTFT